MAACYQLIWLAALIIVVYTEFTRYNRPIPIENKEDCNQATSQREFYDITKLECVPCSQNDTFQVASADCKCLDMFSSIFVWKFSMVLTT